jgi:hypothetical protein
MVAAHLAPNTAGMGILQTVGLMGRYPELIDACQLQ